MYTTAYRETKNDYSNASQTIKGAQIATIRTQVGATPLMTPDAIGQFCICQSSQGPETYVYVATGLTSNDWVDITEQAPPGDVLLNRPNNFTSVEQKIMNRQITTIVIGTTPQPAIVPDFEGQFYVYDDGTFPMLYIASGNPAVWHNVQDIELPRNVVLEDRENDFALPKQTIDGRQIVTVVSSDTPPTQPPEIEGQFYIERSNPKEPNLYCSVKTNNTLAWSEISQGGGVPLDIVTKDAANNFTNVGQTIKDRQIMTYLSGADKPNIVPDFVGQVYMQPQGTTTHGFAIMWVSSGTTQPTDWSPVGQLVFPDYVVRADIMNDWEKTGQYIKGKQILSFVDGQDQTPEQLKVKPDFDGQLFIASKLVDGVWNATVWIGKITSPDQYTWMPILDPKTAKLDLNDLAYLSKNNTFKGVEQHLGEDVPDRLIVGSRVVDRNPNATAIYPKMVGEIAVYPEKLEDDTFRYHIFMGIKANAPNAWKDITYGIDYPTEVVRANKINTFTEPVQKVKMNYESTNVGHVMGAFIGEQDPMKEHVQSAYAGQIYLYYNKASELSAPVITAYISLMGQSTKWAPICDPTPTVG